MHAVQLADAAKFSHKSSIQTEEQIMIAVERISAAIVRADTVLITYLAFLQAF
jgi:hypothetical protein